MKKDIPLGVNAQVSETVEFRHTLTAHNPSLPPVYSTPNMIGLMEKAAFYALQPYCGEGEITVGTAINIDHRAASTIGARIVAEARLESFDGRFYTLRVTARDENKEIGRGTVGRAVVNIQQFRQRFQSSNSQAPSQENFLASLRAKAELFAAMHHGPNILVLVNAWDGVSARILEEAGAGAIASSSAGVAFSLGYPDGQKISRTEMLSQVARIARAVKVPVTADVESGYGDRPEDAALTARAAIECGAVGMNLEDRAQAGPHPLVDLALQLEKIHAVREAAARAGVPLVLNARTDVYLKQVGPPEKRYDETVRRLAVYRDAGADCVFAPGVQDAATISRLVQDLQCPLNILAMPGSPSIRELHSLGVARVSLGSGPMRACYTHLRKIADEMKGQSGYSTLEGAIPGMALNELIGRNFH